ncbi:MAG: metallophosphoesterase family protein [Acidobacteria bacterium]|nr:metallophosphoesterase family protein [Acidobacteriota bacterium]
MGESTAVLLFVCAVAAVYLFAALAVVRFMLRRLGFMERPARAARIAERGALVLAAAGLLCFAYGYFVEPYWPQVTHVRIESAKLKGAQRPVRVVHISDLHCDPSPRLEERLPDLIAAEHPDLIVFTGDSINEPGGLPVLRKLLPRLAAVAPTYAVRGNWDTAFWRREQLFEGTGVVELKKEAARVDVAGTSLWVAGAPFASLADPPDGVRSGIENALKDVPPEAFALFLYHTPDAILEAAETKRVDLYCAGHTHGGQVALPFYGALVTLSKFGKKYESGLHREGQTWLYVTRGVGMEGGPAPRVRFFARPEVTVIELIPAEARP